MSAEYVSVQPPAALRGRVLRLLGHREHASAGTGWSTRHLQSRFRDQVGLTPGTARRVLHFGRAAGLVGRGGAPLAAIAATCGYADQAHLTREFRALAGLPPAAFRAEVFASVQDLPPGPDQDRAS
ncbi:helix-turn-helix domain-containing protein [Pseudonocardia sp. HH130629-09]|uniref:helix-turn-helix domain-containing protein n=1 Tax=Pseudonocardia sp. HH130629-09 TaxID=1641402 RepID=UPI0006CB38D9|nr:helix-turn-helix domain-containing protein [Pseudonocardia sp. HH130629-09]ALE83757.1 hypothetical protein XF36_11855 [Pseudonocardia sp. HH130629-09]